ncbi:MULTISPECIES: Lar family restriction alleviation protein [unclassified Duganella]|uniref:Lar family restriction alleviation protein n=1 Tax=unclassified Duganella TaxID=2636909 RepID=UPI0006F43330|nr:MULTISPECIES: Lar family restriction alleviation protein [unclassified Duganella]KQV59309.1 hypothetical protein ASD07_24110 [Duganella sp. Root336D2]
MLEFDPMLASCPFCGGPAGFYREAQGNFRNGIEEPVNAWLAGCIGNTCAVHVDTEGDESKEGAAAKWNARRASPATLPPQIHSDLRIAWKLLVDAGHVDAAQRIFQFIQLTAAGGART